MLSLLPPADILPRMEPILAAHLTALSSLAKQPPDQNSKSRAVFVLKLLFTTLDIARRDNDQPESEAGVTMVDPGSGQRAACTLDPEAAAAGGPGPDLHLHRGRGGVGGSVQ